jgi:hypothetical protein
MNMTLISPRPAPMAAALLGLSVLSALLVLTGCGGAAPPRPYPEPESGIRTFNLRRDFVDAYLRGQWSASATFYRKAVAADLSRDDFCAAAYNAHLAWRLKRFSGLTDPETRERYRKLRRLGFGCPDTPGLPAPHAAFDAAMGTDKDRRYQAMVEAGRFSALASALESESDPLFASVHARKGARAALAAGSTQQARRLAGLARETDAARQWLVFLVLDWRLLAEMAETAEEEEIIGRRVDVLLGLMDRAASRSLGEDDQDRETRDARPE